jgi:hypothetical protein
VVLLDLKHAKKWGGMQVLEKNKIRRTVQKAIPVVILTSSKGRS